MHKLLKLQLKKIYGKKHNTKNLDPDVQHLIQLVDEAYHDYEETQEVIEHALEVGSQELSDVNKQIMKSRDLLRCVTDSIPDAIIYKDLELRYIGCNGRFETITGKTADEIIGKRDEDLLAPDIARHYRDIGQYVLDTREMHISETWGHNPENAKMLYRIRMVPLFDFRQKIIGLVGIISDITQEYTMQEELKKNETMLIQQSRFAAMGEMLSMIAHQWRQPLNAVSLAAAGITLHYDMNQEPGEKLIREKCDFIEEKVQLMSRTIDDFSNFFKPHKESIYFSLADTIPRAINIIQPQLEHRNIQLISQLEHGLQIYGAPNEMEHAILNLLANAYDAIKSSESAKRIIKVQAIKTDDNIVVTVSDTGGGIPVSVSDKIFDPYFTTKHATMGTGIGLYMTKTIIEEHFDGSIEANNNEEGAVFTITIPQRVPEKKGEK